MATSSKSALLLQILNARVSITGLGMSSFPKSCIAEKQRRGKLHTFCGLAGSSIVYQSTKIVPSAVLVGAIAIDVVLSASIPCSMSKRSCVYGAVEVRVNSRWIDEPLVHVRVASTSG